MDPFHFAQSGSGARRRWLSTVAAAAIFIVSLLVPAAGNAALEARATPGARAVSAANSPGEFARLEARAAKLSRQYRGELVTLTEAQSDAKATLARALRLRRQLGQAQREIGSLAAASYMGGVQDPVAVVMGGGDPQHRLATAATLDFVLQQRSARQQALVQFMAAEQQAQRAAQAKVARLRRLVAALVSQRRQVAALMAKFQPESPVIGDSITPRMRQVRDEVDRRFGPFSSIGCFRAEASGEHPLGRACDFMLSTGGVLPSASNVQRGYDIASWAQANASRLGIMYIIYRQRIWDIRMASAGWQPMEDRGSVTANHFDHVHISVF